MTGIRRLFVDHAFLTGCIIALALLMKVLVPAGFMPTMSAGAVSIEICTGYGVQTVTVATPGAEHRQDPSGHQGPEHQGKEMPCAFSGLSAPSLAAADPVLLAIAIAFIVATAFRRVAAEAAEAPAYLRPFLRGPPATA